ncbi:Pr6Pr family membrane protein [Frondihabitans cladoniiphilus]|uniref:FAR-17a/AIG1-like protein n=1 Tax=Frondihabitans cladoniiphilus TaxID=715785 RepID=A0ABP8W1W3_9MICO
MTSQRLFAVLRLLFAALGLVAVASQFGVTLANHYSIPNFFSYFTNLSNLITIVVFVIGAVRILRGVPDTRAWNVVRFCNTVNMVFVGLVFNILLTGGDVGAVIPWVNTIVHIVMPIVVLLDWIVLPPAARLRLVTAVVGLIFPVAYSVYSLIRGAAIGFYPYPFYNPAKVGGYGGVTLYLIALIVGLIVLALIVVLITWARRPAGARARDRVRA